MLGVPPNLSLRLGQSRLWWWQFGSPRSAQGCAAGSGYRKGNCCDSGRWICRYLGWCRLWRWQFGSPRWTQVCLAWLCVQDVWLKVAPWKFVIIALAKQKSRTRCCSLNQDKLSFCGCFVLVETLSPRLNLSRNPKMCTWNLFWAISNSCL